jgi:hypothetical protein
MTTCACCGGDIELYDYSVLCDGLPLCELCGEHFGLLLEVRHVAKRLGVTRRRVEGWVEQGFIEPDIRGRGKGSRHKFHVDQLKVMRRIVAMPRTVKEVIG